MEKKPFVSAVLVAAGASTRMGGGVCKQLISICGMPAFYYTLRAFEEAPSIREIIVVCREEEQTAFEELAKQGGFQKIAAYAPGGATRQQSVFSGIAAASGQAEYYAVHDGARCLIEPRLIERVTEDAVCHRASSAAVPMKDTIKVTNAEGFVESTPDRSTLWAVQTPQIFEKALYIEAIQEAAKKGADYTDDCQLVENIGIQVHLCMGSYENSKLTTAEDIAFAEQIVKRREVAIK